MPRIQALHHIKGLTAPDLADDNTIWPHTQRSSDQVSNGDFPAALHIGISCLHAHQIRNIPDLQLCIVLDRDNSLLRRYVIRKGI